jgi:hypothetical protein
MRIPSARRIRLGLVATALVPAFGLAACAADQGDLQTKIKNALNGNLSSDAKTSGLEHADSVSCPSNVQLKTGTKFTCTVTGTDTDGKASQEFTFKGTIVQNNNIQPDSLTRVGGGTPATPSTTTT